MRFLYVWQLFVLASAAAARHLLAAWGLFGAGSPPPERPEQRSLDGRGAALTFPGAGGDPARQQIDPGPAAGGDPALAALVDTLTLTGGRAAALQSGLVPAALVARPGWLREFAEGYFAYLGRLPLLAVVGDAERGRRLGPWFAPRRLTAFRFAPPYLTAKRGGRELRYPIVGGFFVHGPSGYIAFGHAPEGGRARIWIEVLEFWPRLGLGPLYLLTEVVLHRIVTVSYMRRIAAG